jgi:UDP-glucuronate 4-epimerase
MKVLITGSAGFIGSHLSEHVLGQGHSVVGLDNFDPFYDRKIKEGNLEHSQESKDFSFHELDICDHEALVSLLTKEKPDVVVHLAAKAGVRPSLKAPLDYVKHNIEATVSLLEAMKKTEVKNIVFASSSSLYGKSEVIPFSEDDPLKDMISVYAASKKSCEEFTNMYHNLYGVNVINLRFFTVYGPRQRPDLAIHKFLKANLQEEKITLFGDGSMARDYTFVKDTVQGVFGAIERVQKENGLNETYNLGNSTPVSLKELITAIEKVTGKPCIVKHEEVPLGDVPITYANNERANKNLNYAPTTDIEVGLTEFVKWMKEKLA